MKLTKDMLTEMVKEVIQEQMEDAQSSKMLRDVKAGKKLSQLMQNVKAAGHEIDGQGNPTVFFDTGELLKYFKVVELGLDNSGRGPYIYLQLEKKRKASK